jgi:hypothetical protein
LINGFRAGSEPALKRREGETDRAFARAAELIGLAHFRSDVVRDGLVQLGFGIRKFVVGGIGLAFREEWRVVELDQFLLDHPPHEVAGIDLVGTVAGLAVETI